MFDGFISYFIISWCDCKNFGRAISYPDFLCVLSSRIDYCVLSSADIRGIGKSAVKLIMSAFSLITFDSVLSSIATPLAI